jgi:hypothetical protein
MTLRQPRLPCQIPQLQPPAIHTSFPPRLLHLRLHILNELTSATYDVRLRVMFRQQLRLAALARPKPRCRGRGVGVVEDDVGAPRQTRFAGWAAADLRRGDAVDEGGGREWVAGLHGGPAGRVSFEKGVWGCGRLHFLRLGWIMGILCRLSDGKGMWWE